MNAELPSPDDRDDRGEYLAEVQYSLPPALEAFHDLYVKAYLNYAHTMLGDKEAARAVVRSCFTHLALNWQRVTRSPSPEAYAWALLKARVDTHLRLAGLDPQMVETAAFQRAARDVLESVRSRFEVMETALGLYTAIASLPERQYDVIVLLYVLGYPSCRVARIMGVERDTVRSHRRLAKRRISQRLGLPRHQATDEEKE
ncbi:sigma-70 family RNA polymerase sigma factor [Streptomyces sp. NPDC101062]|uniref:sigma-70 family RNA polymerase sigma factor n=1 Tax=unclassified Streptomyces TaxID=2593676 RepID=UPI002E77A69C|nr:sigma-70 family RNA polymerase sigma factor [Streptomyces sp. JV176]MEE1800938.1 sigma-70 family RNA polymerase sigma factor [Streptomyces sp. JV176]